MSFFVNFFTKLQEIAKDVDLTFRVKEKNGRYTVLVQPELANANKVKALTITGTAAELDDNFFGEVQKSMVAIEGLTSNAEEVVEDAASVKAKDKAPSKKTEEKGKANEKTATKDSKADKKKKPAPQTELAQRDIFSQAAPQQPPQSEPAEPETDTPIGTEDVVQETEEGEETGDRQEETE